MALQWFGESGLHNLTWSPVKTDLWRCFTACHVTWCWLWLLLTIYILCVQPDKWTVFGSSLKGPVCRIYGLRNGLVHDWSPLASPSLVAETFTMKSLHLFLSILKYLSLFQIKCGWIISRIWHFPRESLLHELHESVNLSWYDGVIDTVTWSLCSQEVFARLSSAHLCDSWCHGTKFSLWFVTDMSEYYLCCSNVLVTDWMIKVEPLVSTAGLGFLINK